MARGDAVEVTSGESETEPAVDIRALLEPVVRRVVHSLGGYEPDVGYRMGDEVSGCLRDLKKLWRKDDTDDERTIARIFWETRVLPNDLVPILLVTAGKGLVEDKRAIACADLLTAMTWPIDMAEELKELDEELDKGTDYTQLIQSHLHYKAALLKPGVMEALFGIMLVPISKPPKVRMERDGQVVNVVLHLIRNLAFIRDLPYDMRLSSDYAQLSSLQNKLIKALSETHTLKFLLTIAANADDDPLLNGWNTLVLEIVYLLFRGIKPAALAVDQMKQPKETLHRLLAEEGRIRKELSRKASSRHSRFGTTIAVKLNPNKNPHTVGDASDSAAITDAGPRASRSLVLHRQQAINHEAGSILDITKRQTAKRGPRLDELTREDNLSVEARTILQTFAIEFVEACFNPFLSSLLKDIRAERAKITEKDNLRLLFVTKWFLEFFLSRKDGAKEHETQWGFGLIAEVTERTWIVWVLKRMRGAVEEKPKQWTELQTGIECLTQLLLLIDSLSSADKADPVLDEAAEVLQQQIIYNGEVLDIAFESLRSYKPGTQSLAYLDSGIHMAYALMRMLEKWSESKGGDMYVRKKKVKKKEGTKGVREENEIEGVEGEVEEEMIHETMFTFETFEMKLAHADITHTLLTYLTRYTEFSSSECMRRVVSLMHRQAVKAKAEGLFFKASTLDLFKTIMANQKSFPREQPYKDLVNLIRFILRQFFKALSQEPFLAIETFYPKNRGHWKQFSSWEQPPKNGKAKRITEDARFPPEVKVKEGYSWSDQLGIAIAALAEAGLHNLVTWTKSILVVVIQQRQRIIEEMDLTDEHEDIETANALRTKEPSSEAVAQFKDYLIPYLTDDQAEAGTKNPHLKLLWRLAKFVIADEDADELLWCVPAGIMPSYLQRTATVIEQFLEKPFDLEGKKASQLLNQKRRRRRRVRSPSPFDENVALGDEDPPRTRKREKREREIKQYKSAQFIEDSDEEYGNMEAFLEREKATRERIMTDGRLAAMKPTCTKKRRRKGKVNSATSKKRKGVIGDDPSHEGISTRAASRSRSSTASSSESESQGGDLGSDSAAPNSAPPPPQVKPRPRPRAKRALSPHLTDPAAKSDEPPSGGSPLRDDSSHSVDIAEKAVSANVKKSHAHLVISDEEDG